MENKNILDMIREAYKAKSASAKDSVNFDDYIELKYPEMETKPKDSWDPIIKENVVLDAKLKARERDNQLLKKELASLLKSIDPLKSQLSRKEKEIERLKQEISTLKREKETIVRKTHDQIEKIKHETRDLILEKQRLKEEIESTEREKSRIKEQYLDKIASLENLVEKYEAELAKERMQGDFLRTQLSEKSEFIEGLFEISRFKNELETLVSNTLQAIKNELLKLKVDQQEITDTLLEIQEKLEREESKKLEGESLTPDQRKVYYSIMNNPGWTPKQHSEALDMSVNKVKKICKFLRNQNLVRSDEGRYYIVS